MRFSFVWSKGLRLLAKCMYINTHTFLSVRLLRLFEIHYIAAPQHVSFHLSHRQFLVFFLRSLSLSLHCCMNLIFGDIAFLHPAAVWCLIFPTILIVQPVDWKSSENSNGNKKKLSETSLLHSYNTLTRLLIRILPPLFRLCLVLLIAISFREHAVYNAK